jgi:transcriptional regulator with XRE-family HTH domain
MQWVSRKPEEGSMTDAAGPGGASASAEAQRALYGEPWSQRFGRLMATYRLSQARLAGVIGLSAPMLSQLISGQRVKVGNPAVFGRIVSLEQLSDDPRVLGGDPEAVRAVLDEVAASSPTLTAVTAVTAVTATTVSTPDGASPPPTRDPAGATTPATPASGVVGEGVLVAGLAALAATAPLHAAADAAQAAGGAGLAALLRAAAAGR